MVPPSNLVSMLLLDSPVCGFCHLAADISHWTIQQQRWKQNFTRTASCHRCNTCI